MTRKELSLKVINKFYENSQPKCAKCPANCPQSYCQILQVIDALIDVLEDESVDIFTNDILTRIRLAFTKYKNR